MSFTTHVRRVATVVGGTTAALALATSTASAHHCLKEWNDAARAQVSSGTAWMAMSDFVEFAVTEFFGLPAECAAHADEWTAAWMQWSGTETEPTIHTKATVGGGAAHQGKSVPAFDYLGDDDFAFLEGLIFSEPDCA